MVLSVHSVLFYKHLLLEKIDWGKVIIFHLDEYKGMPKTHPASFRRFLNERFVEKIHPKKVFYLEGDASAYRGRNYAL